MSADQPAGCVQKALENSAISSRSSSKRGVLSEFATIRIRRLSRNASIKHVLHPSHSHTSRVSIAHDPCTRAGSHSSPLCTLSRPHPITSVQFPPVPTQDSTSSQLNSSKSNTASSWSLNHTRRLPSNSLARSGVHRVSSPSASPELDSSPPGRYARK